MPRFALRTSCGCNIMVIHFMQNNLTWLIESEKLSFRSITHERRSKEKKCIAAGPNSCDCVRVEQNPVKFCIQLIFDGSNLHAEFREHRAASEDRERPRLDKQLQ